MIKEDVVPLQWLTFVSGFIILSLEIVGVRVLGPFVGTTVPVWAAVIGVTLTASSAGYYLGGALADQSFSTKHFSVLAFGAGLALLLIPTLRKVMPFIAARTSYGVGALLGSISMFFIPIMCLSALITYVIRMLVRTIDSIGQVHGDLYALATIGSALGVFLTSYVFIPFFTVPHILYGLSALLFLSCLPIIAFSRERHTRG